MPSARSANPPHTGPTLFKSARAFETWLKKNHAASDGLWLKIAKRGAAEPSVTYFEAVEIALCWGWIDGQKKSLDAQHYLQRFTPRRARSIWSKVNVDKVAALIQAGRMQTPGHAQIEAAKADGRWARAYDGARSSTVPDDLSAALGRAGRQGLLCHAQRDQPLRGAVAHPDGREAGHARPADRPAGGHARARRDDPHLQAPRQDMRPRANASTRWNIPGRWRVYTCVPHHGEPNMFRTLSLPALVLAGLLAAGCASMAADAPAKSVDGVLVGANGMTLYTFDRDTTPGKSACNGPCATNWPPLMAPAGATASGDWSIVTRDDGSKQWAYKGKPVYYWAKDQKPGDRTGDGFNNVWHVVRAN